MGHSPHQLAVLDDRTAAHSLNNSAGFAQQLFIRHADCHGFSVLVPSDNPFNPDGIPFGFAAGNTGQNLRLSDLDFIPFCDWNRLSRHGFGAHCSENTVCGVFGDASHADLRLKRTEQFARLTPLSFVHADHRRRHQTAVLERKLCPTVALTHRVAQRAEFSGCRIKIRDRADSRHAVAHQQSEMIFRIRRALDRLNPNPDVHAVPLALYDNLLSACLLNDFGKVLPRRNRHTVDRAQDIAGAQSRLLRRTHRSGRALHLRHAADHHTLCRHAHAGRHTGWNHHPDSQRRRRQHTDHQQSGAQCFSRPLHVLTPSRYQDG